MPQEDASVRLSARLAGHVQQKLGEHVSNLTALVAIVIARPHALKAREEYVAYRATMQGGIKPPSAPRPSPFESAAQHFWTEQSVRKLDKPGDCVNSTRQPKFQMGAHCAVPFLQISKPCCERDPRCDIFRVYIVQEGRCPLFAVRCLIAWLHEEVRRRNVQQNDDGFILLYCHYFVYFVSNEIHLTYGNSGGIHADEQNLARVCWIQKSTERVRQLRLSGQL
eukprot:scaffold90121_cov30-Tisochrysis_lutea.AAC.12